MKAMEGIISLLWSYLSIINILLLLIFLLLLNYARVLYEFRGMPPGPRHSCLPVVGNLLSFAFGFEETIESYLRTYGRVYSIKLGDYKLVSATSAESIKESLIKKSSDFGGRPPLHGVLEQTLGGKDLAYGNGASWKYHRKIFSASLRQYLSDLQLLTSPIHEQATRLTTFIEEQNGKSFDPERILATCLGDVICAYTFGKYYNSSFPEFHQFLGVLDEALELERDADLFVLDMFPWAKYLPLETYKRNKQITDKMYAVLRQVFKKREKDFDVADPAIDFMTTLLKIRHEAEVENDDESLEFLSEDYLLSSILDMFSAGYETTTTTLKWAILFLVNHPHYQTEIQDALDKVVGRDRMPNLEDRPNLQLIQATIMETLRVGNTSPQTIPHYTVKDTTLCGYRVPKDTIILIDLEAMHKDPKIWENPDVFYPHRHLDSEGQLKGSQGTLLPFGAGRRVCAGEAYSKAKLFVFLSCMLQKFTFVAEEGKPPPSIKGAKGLTLSPLPYKIRAIKRQ